MGHVPNELEHDADERSRRDAHGLKQRHQATKRWAFASLLAVVALTASGLGAWQVERRHWKLELIRAVNARVHAPPIPAPGPAQWRALNAEDDAYRRVQVEGQFDYRHEVRVWAVTGRGEGSWLMTPLRTRDGWSVLVNRGFVPAGERQIRRPPGLVSVIGLLRVTEPGGTFLRSNDPAAGRWYSRDVAAIVQAETMRATAPYFIDADASSNSISYPVGGLTPVTFRNAHVSYAVTWFTLAALSLVGIWFVLRERRNPD